MAQTRRCDISGDPDAASCHLSRFAGDDWEVLGPVCRLFYASKWITGWLRSPSRSGKRPGCCARGGEKSCKNIFVEVGGEWCTWCHILDRFFHEHPNLEALRDKNYVPMKVSMSQENPNRAFFSRFPYIHGYPHIFILDAEGKLIRSQPTKVLEDGQSYNAKRFQKLLEQCAPKRQRVARAVLSSHLRKYAM